MLEAYIQNPLLIETAPPPTEEASTLDWDTVFAVNYDDINSAIKKNKGCRPQKAGVPAIRLFPVLGQRDFRRLADYSGWRWR
jgi:hypothetical protein